MDIRLLDAADRAAFRDLRLAALASDPDAFMMTVEEERRVPRLAVERFLDAATETNFFLGAFDRTVLQGMVGAIGSSYMKRRHVTEILSLYVRPESRGQGLGRRLMDLAIARAFRGAHIRRIKVQVVATNHTALALYQSLGFIECGREPQAYATAEKDWDLVEMSLSRPVTMLA